MTISKIKKEIIKRLEEKEISVNRIKIVGFNKEEKTVKSIRISLDGCDSGYNILYRIKRVIDDLETEFGFSTNERLVEF